MPGVDVPMDLLWDVAVKTALVLVIIYGGLWALRRYWGRSGVGRQGTAILILQSAHLGPGRTVHVIGVGGKTLLIGATSQHISLLSELSQPEEPLSTEAVERPPTFERCFRDALEVVGSVSARLRSKPTEVGRGPGLGSGAEE